MANPSRRNQVTSLLATQQVANRLATNQVTEEEDEVCRPLGKPAHEVAVPILAVRHEHPEPETVRGEDRKSTRLNSSHSQISYAVFCLKKKTLRYTVSNTR